MLINYFWNFVQKLKLKKFSDFQTYLTALYTEHRVWNLAVTLINCRSPLWLSNTEIGTFFGQLSHRLNGSICHTVLPKGPEFFFLFSCGICSLSKNYLCEFYVKVCFDMILYWMINVLYLWSREIWYVGKTPSSSSDVACFVSRVPTVDDWNF